MVDIEIHGAPWNVLALSPTPNDMGIIFCGKIKQSIRETKLLYFESFPRWHFKESNLKYVLFFIFVLLIIHVHQFTRETLLTIRPRKSCTFANRDPHLAGWEQYQRWHPHVCHFRSLTLPKYVAAKLWQTHIYRELVGPSLPRLLPTPPSLGSAHWTTQQKSA